jgi:adenylate cyclase
MISEETLKSKAFEKFAASHGVNIKHYHADNGRFKDKLFSKDIEEKGQTISFCGVGAHIKME